MPKPQPKREALSSLDLDALRERAERARLENELVLLESQTAVLESGWWDDYGQFGGSDAFERLRDRDGTRWVPLSVPSDRRSGANWPLWRTEQELGELRQKSRMVCASNSFGRCLLRNTVNFIGGGGYSYEAQPKEPTDTDPDTPSIQAGGTADRLTKAVQDYVDSFCARTRWNSASLDPKTSASHVSPREREMIRRVKRDGEAFMRFFRHDDGTVDVRWIEPEQIRNPPGGTEQNGWTYGIKHQVEPFVDVETILAYYVAYKELRSKSDGKNPMGEEVPADEIIHVKNVDDDSTVKRGVPEFSWDVFDALQRASKLQRFISLGAAVRAATAETWKHTTGTNAQISALAAGLKERTVTDPITGNQETVERVRPGMIRHIPASREPVPLPTNTGTPEHLEAVQGDLRQASAGVCAPEYLTGDASNANYSSTQEAGTPFVRATIADQDHFKAVFLTCIWKAIRWAVECGKLPAEVLTAVVIAVEAPQAQITDDLKTAQKDQIYYTIKAKSARTISQELGLDPDQVANDFEEEQERFGTALGMPPGMGADDPGAPEAKPPAPTP